MIIVGSQRGGAKNLALHLLKQENERVQVHELRGFSSDNLIPALQESHAMSRGTRCKQHLFSVSFNPPKDADASTADFEAAIDRVEEKMKLDGQPRAIVFHDKRGDDGQMRRHAHAVWCRIDTEHMRAVPLPHHKRKLNTIARDLYLEHGWTMPRGFLSHQDRDPRNFSLAEWQQAKRAKKDPRELKTMFQERWAISDSRAAFAHALEEQGYILARGDRRGFIAVDHKGDPYAISRWCNVRAKDVRARLGDPADLPDQREAQAKAAKIVAERLEALKAQERQAARAKLERLKAEKQRKDEQDRAARDELHRAQAERRSREAAEQRARIRKGLAGLLDRITGKRKRIETQNQEAEKQTKLREDREKQAFAERRKANLDVLRRRAQSLKSSYAETARELRADISALQKPVEPEQARPKAERKIPTPAAKRAETPKIEASRDAARQASIDQEKEARREAFKKSRTPTKDRPRRRSRARDGPAPRR